jgi:hypothetical protein
MKTLLLTFITFLSINANAMDINKLTSMDFAKPCNTSNIIKIIPSMEERIVNINNATTKISLSIPVNPCLLLSMVWKESTFKSNQKSKKNAKGLLQVLPSTEKEVIKKMGYELNKMITSNLDSNLSGKELKELSVGAFYMHSLVVKFNNEDLAIVAYNEGSARVMKKLAKGIMVGNNHNYLKGVKHNLVAMK